MMSGSVPPPTPDDQRADPRHTVRSALLLYRSMARSGEVETTASSRAFQAALAALDSLAADLAQAQETLLLADILADRYFRHYVGDSAYYAYTDARALAAGSVAPPDGEEAV